MLRVMKVVAVGIGLVCVAVAAEHKLASGKRIFIDKMPQDLDMYIKAEFTKQGVPLHIVAAAAEADYIMTGTST
jgi:hypothetical protein